MTYKFRAEQYGTVRPSLCIHDLANEDPDLVPLALQHPNG